MPKNKMEVDVTVLIYAFFLEHQSPITLCLMTSFNYTVLHFRLQRILQTMTN